MTKLDSRKAFAEHAVKDVAGFALKQFIQIDRLVVEAKGLQDWVSNADRAVEDKLRASITASFPEDGIVGEERASVPSQSGYTWVIDPIDGTSNFVTGTPAWCVVLACVFEEQTVLAVICDPVSRETYTASKGEGAFLNGKPILVNHQATSLDQGTVGVGHSLRVTQADTLNLLAGLLENNGLFRRSGSGALDLAYVAAGRLIGYVEPHMNAWDCIASLLLIEEAGGSFVPFDMTQMLERGGPVIAGCPGVFNSIKALTDKAYQS